MDPIENSYNKRFKDKELSGDDFDAGGLWDAIAGELDEKDVSNWWSRFKWSLFLLLLIGMSAATILLLTGKNKDDQRLANSTTVTEKAVIDPSTIDQTMPSPFSSSSEGEDAIQTRNGEPMERTTSQDGKLLKEAQEELSLARNREIDASTSKVYNHSTDKKITTSTPTPATATNMAANPVGEMILPSGKRQENIETETENISLEQIPATLTLAEETVNAASEGAEVINPGSSLPLSNNQITAQLPLEEFTLFPDNLPFEVLPIIEDNRVERSKSTAWMLGFSGGTNYSRNTFKADNDSEWETEKNETEKASWGSSFDLDASMLWRNKWLARTGLTYNKLWTQFDYERNFDTLVFHENVLLRVVVNSTTGVVVNEIYGDTSVLAAATQITQHHSQYTTVGIPLEVGYMHRRKRWNYGLTAGVVLNFRINQSGKSWGPDQEIITFGKQDPTALINNFNVGLRVSPFLGYRITNGLLLTVAPKWTWQSNSIFDRPDLSVQTQQFNFNLGVQIAIGRR